MTSQMTVLAQSDLAGSALEAHTHGNTFRGSCGRTRE